MGSQGVIEENDLSEPRGEYAPTHAFGIRLNTHVRTHARMHDRTHARTHARPAPGINSRRILRRLCAFMRVYARAYVLWQIRAQRRRIWLGKLFKLAFEQLEFSYTERKVFVIIIG